MQTKIALTLASPDSHCPQHSLPLPSFCFLESPFHTHSNQSLPLLLLLWSTAHTKHCCSIKLECLATRLTVIRSNLVPCLAEAMPLMRHPLLVGQALPPLTCLDRLVNDMLHCWLGCGSIWQLWSGPQDRGYFGTGHHGSSSSTWKKYPQ